jgi:hypothetical protein
LGLQVMQKDYGLYVWPCSIVLAEYIWQNWERFHGAFVLEVWLQKLPPLLNCRLLLFWFSLCSSLSPFCCLWVFSQ